MLPTQGKLFEIQALILELPLLAFLFLKTDANYSINSQLSQRLDRKKLIIHPFSTLTTFFIPLYQHLQDLGLCFTLDFLVLNYSP